MGKITIEKDSMEYKDACFQLAKGSPEYFNEEGFKQMNHDLIEHELYTAVKDGTPVGFATINLKNQSVAEISWLVVDKGLRGQSIGSRLIEYIIRDIKQTGYRLLEVKTLSEIDDYEPYKITRDFYLKHGFILLETICPYPGWGPDDPCDIYVRILD